MKRYLLRRAVSGLISLIVFQTIMFFVIQCVFPGDYSSQFVLSLSPKEMEELRLSLGLDLSLTAQYFRWLSSLVTGNPPFYRNMVFDLLWYQLPATLLAFGTATILAFLLGEWLGKVVAWRKQNFITDGVTLGAIILSASFPPWAVFLAGILLAPILPKHSFGEAELFWRKSVIEKAEVIRDLVAILIVLFLILLIANVVLVLLLRRRLPVAVIVSLLVLGMIFLPYLFGFGPHARFLLEEAVIPILAYTLIAVGELLILMKTSMGDVVNEQFVQTARAKGLAERMVRDRHAGRTALLPVVSRLMISLPYVMGGVLIVETATGWGGIGSALFGSVVGQFMPGIMAAFLVIGLFSLAARLGLDVLQVYLDPRLHRVGE